MASTDLSDVLPEEVEAEVKLAAEISMGTEVSEEDINNIMHLSDQVRIVSVFLDNAGSSEFMHLYTYEYVVCFTGS